VQLLNVSANNLQSLPYELSSLPKLKDLSLTQNLFTEPPISVLRQMTALATIDLSHQFPPWQPVRELFEVPSSLLPILHKQLVSLDVRQKRYDLQPAVSLKWDPVSLFHLGRAVVDVSNRVPVPKMRF
jgi:hypothetical protein